MDSKLKEAFLTALVVGILLLPLAGARTTDGMNGLTVEWHILDVAVAALIVFLGRYTVALMHDGHLRWTTLFALTVTLISFVLPFPSHFLKAATIVGAVVIFGKGVSEALLHRVPGPRHSATLRLNNRWKKVYGNLNIISCVLLCITIVFPLMPFASRYSLDVAIMVMTYIMLAWGLNITVGYAGLLDLGYAGFYAIGAYSTALLAQNYNLSFWEALPISGLIAAMTGFIVGLPVLRLRGDYFAVVTLGFGEIVRLVITNWTNLTNGPNGISDIPRPTFFGLEFAHQASAGHRAFHEFFSLAFSPLQRVIFLYYLIFCLALGVGWFSSRLRLLPLGRAWEAFRENEIATAALGINRWGIKLAAYSLGAAVAGLAGSFFATRQAFISPDSFTFTESATILAIVILGGLGHPLGIALAAIFIIGLPEAFREFEQYRMLAFGAGMVLIMIWRPGGLLAQRTPTVLLLTTNNDTTVVKDV